MLAFKHEGILAFVERLLRDREFSEWYVSRPTQALASHGLSSRDLADVDEVLRGNRFRPDLSQALRPTVQLLLQLAAEAGDTDQPEVIERRWERLDEQLRVTRQRVAEARARNRPWWKFW